MIYHSKMFDPRLRCHICGARDNLQLHHIYPGGLRKESDKMGAMCYLCQNHHTGRDGVHSHPEKLRELKAECQKWFEKEGMTRSEFMKHFRKNYLNDND